MRLMLCTVALSIMLGAQTLPPNFSGKWIIQGAGREGGRGAVRC
jgi:hypothetical protein